MLGRSVVLAVRPFVPLIAPLIVEGLTSGDVTLTIGLSTPRWSVI